MRPPSTSKVDSCLAESAGWLGAYSGRPLARRDVVELASLAVHAYTGRRAAADKCLSAAVSTLEHLSSGKDVDADVLRANLHRLYANWHFIHEGMSVPVWSGGRTDADMVVIGIDPDVRPAPDKSGMLYRLRIKVKSGLCAGILLWQAFGEQQIYAFLQRKAGVSRCDCAAEEISGMSFRATISSDRGCLRIRDMEATAEQRKANRLLAEARSDMAKCPVGRPCNVCGKTVEECPLAVWKKP